MRLAEGQMRRDLWIASAFAIYGVAVFYLLVSGTLHGFIVYPFLLLPFVLDQLYLFLTRTRYRLIYAVNALVLSVAIAVLLYVALR